MTNSLFDLEDYIELTIGNSLPGNLTTDFSALMSFLRNEFGFAMEKVSAGKFAFALHACRRRNSPDGGKDSATARQICVLLTRPLKNGR